MKQKELQQKKLRSITRLFMLLLLSFTYFGILNAQERTISGTITDNSGATLPGVNVIMKGSTNGTVSDIDGKFSIKVPNNQAILTFTFVGYKTQEIEVGEQTTMNIVLPEDVQELNEVVVIGYGVQKKKLSTGANINVSGKNIQGLNTNSTMDALKGISPGVSITQNSGQPGAGTKVNIRGIGTLDKSQPLYIVDGVAVGNIDNLSPSDIESVDVLKDAASAAIYGSRAANGVILVTTKKGKEGKTIITYDAYYGEQNIYKKPELLNAKQYAEIMDEGKINDNKKPFNFAKLVPDWGKIDSGLWKGTNWFEEIVNKDAPVMSHALNISGGSKGSVYSFGASYLSELGILGKGANSEYKRLNLRLNSEHVLIEKDGLDLLVFGENLTFTNSKRPAIRTGSIYWSDVYNMMVTSPFLPMYADSTTDLGYPYNYAIPWNTSESNPIASMINNGKDNFNDNNNITGNAYVDIQPIKGFKLHSSIGVNSWYSSSRSWTPAYNLSTLATAPRDVVKQSMNSGYEWTSSNTLSYFFNTGEHNFTSMIGSELVKKESDLELKGQNENSVFQDGEHAYLDNVKIVDATYTSLSGHDNYGRSLMSYFGRVSYDYKETYLFTFVMRADGSSNFAKGHRWGTFPSVAGGWVLSNEPFLASTNNWLSFLKLRASWGQNGNENIDPFQYLASLSNEQANYFFGTDKTLRTVGAWPPIVPNPDVTWETSEQTNIGADLTFLNNHLTYNFDWYQKLTRDWLLIPQAMDTYGTGASFINGGEIKNSGVEMVLRWNSTVGDFKYSVSGSLAHNKNEVTKIDRADKIIQGPGSVLIQGTSPMFRAEVGYPVGYFWGYKTDGILQDSIEVAEYVDKNGNPIIPGAVPGDVRFVDKNDDGLISDSDKVMIGDPNPDYIFGLQLNVEYKGFSIQVTANGQTGNQIASAYRFTGSGQLQNYTTDVYARWHGKGTSNRFPRMTSAPHINLRNISDIFIEDGDFFKINNLTVGYDFKQLFKKIPLTELRLYFTAKNLYTFTSYPGLDPEVGYGPTDSNNKLNDFPWASGIDLGLYPAPRTYMVGINIKF